jgi:hypothetical protein
MQSVNVKNRQKLTSGVLVVSKRDIRFSVNETTVEYLRWLADNTILGKTENEVARQILIQRLGEMRDENYKPP